MVCIVIAQCSQLLREMGGGGNQICIRLHLGGTECSVCVLAVGLPESDLKVSHVEQTCYLLFMCVSVEVLQ